MLKTIEVIKFFLISIIKIWRLCFNYRIFIAIENKFTFDNTNNCERFAQNFPMINELHLDSIQPPPIERDKNNHQLVNEIFDRLLKFGTEPVSFRWIRHQRLMISVSGSIDILSTFTNNMGRTRDFLSIISNDYKSNT